MSKLTFDNRFREARDRGCAYLLTQQRPDGGFGPVERGVADYYKAVWAYVACGASAEANRLCDWIRKNGMTPEGDFGPRIEEAQGYYYSYYNAWTIIGAHRQGHFDLSQRGMKFVLNFRDPESGGFYSSLTERDPTTKQDLWVVSGCGQAALYTGHLEVARGVGKWMKKLMELQPNFPRQLYTVYSRAEGLLVTPDPDEKIRYVVTPDATQDEYFFHPGIAAGFLAILYKATGESDWLKLARDYMRLAEIAGDYFFSSLRAGKVGWAAAVLFTLTGESKYRDIAIRVGENVSKTQSPDGSWDSIMGDPYRNGATAEMVVWLDEIHQALGGRPSA